MTAPDLDTALPPAPAGWRRSVAESADEVEYRLTEGRATRAKLTVRVTADGDVRLASKRGCRVVAETTASSPAAAAETVRDALDVD